MAVVELASPARQVAALRELQRASADGPAGRPASPRVPEAERDSTGWPAARRRLVEQLVALNVSVFQTFTATEERWRDDVYLGRTPPDAGRDDAYRQVLTDWLDGADEMLGHVRRADAEVGPVAGVGDLAAVVADTRARLADWQPARLSLAVGLREIQLDEAAVAELDRILAAPAPPIPDGLRPVPMTADELRRLRARAGL